ncbi:MAG: hypothetical protein Q9202_002751 [Teloschistes flavicans]
MDQVMAFEGKFNLAYYNNLKLPVDSERCQKTVEDFMALVERNAVESQEGLNLMKEFCELVNHQDVWPLATLVVPQFRLSRVENKEDQARAGGDFTCLNIVLEHIDRLPARTDKHVLATEQDMLRQRF